MRDGDARPIGIPLCGVLGSQRRSSVEPARTDDDVPQAGQALHPGQQRGGLVFGDSSDLEY